jgi:hypothetical protein
MVDGCKRQILVREKVLRPMQSFCVAILLAGTLGTARVPAQEATNADPAFQPPAAILAVDDVSDTRQDPAPAKTAGDGKSSLPDAPTPKIDPVNPNDQAGRQPKRILGVIPNYRAVSANVHLPPQTLKEKFWLATQDTFDYSDFILVGGLAGIAQAQNSQPSFGHGGSAYGQYYWHIFVDGAIENYMTEAIIPALTKEDPRYYTLGHGGLFKRTGYAVSRLVITRNDAGKNTFNISEVVGAGAAAGIGNAYYPAQSNPWVKTYQRWGTQIGLDGVFNILKEFWPDINQSIFHGKY